MKAKRISHLYDDRGPFASVFVDVSRDTENGEHEVGVRVRDVADDLLAAGAPQDIVDSVVERLGRSTDVPAPVSQVLVATGRGVLLDDLVHARAGRSTAHWGPLPDVGDWVALEDNTIPFVLALVDHEGGEIRTYRRSSFAADAEQIAGAPDEHEQKTRGGGLAHSRYQNTAENVWADNAGAVADVLRARISDGLRLVMLAGDPASRTKVREALGDTPSVDVVELEHGGSARDGGDDALDQAVRDVLTEQVTALRLGMVHDLKARLGTGDGVATGVRDVADAFVRGQVETLLIDPPQVSSANLEPREHPGLVLSEAAPGEPVRADVGLVAAAARTGADVVISPTDTLHGTPVAALLRWEGTQQE